jgi:hypothetical protein
MRRAHDQLIKEHPEIQLRSLSSLYNCVGMVFAARRTSIDTNQLDLICRDDGYTAVDVPMVGDLVVYRKRPECEIAHIGQVVAVEPNVQTASQSVTVLSKWGKGGEYLHDVADVPEAYGSQWFFWTERRLA